MRTIDRRGWRPTDTALVLWLFLGAILFGWIVVLVTGQPIVLTP